MAISDCGVLSAARTAAQTRQRGSRGGPEIGPGKAQVLRFPPAPSHRNRLTMRDRMEVLRWAERSDRHGFTRIVFDNASERSGHEPCDYILIYARDALWASWGIACTDSTLTLWNAASGATIGSFGNMADTLSAMMEAAGQR